MSFEVALGWVDAGTLKVRRVRRDKEEGEKGTRERRE